MTDKRLLTKTDVASLLRVSEKTVDRLERDGKIKRHALSKQVRYTQEEIDRYLAGEQPEDAQSASCDATVDKYTTAGESVSP